MHYTDTTIDMDDTQATVCDCNNPPAHAQEARLALFQSELLLQIVSPNSDFKSWLRSFALTQGDSGLPEFIVFWISTPEVAAMTVSGAESCDVVGREIGCDTASILACQSSTQLNSELRAR